MASSYDPEISTNLARVKKKLSALQAQPVKAAHLPGPPAAPLSH